MKTQKQHKDCLLSPREKEILQLIAVGYDNDRIVEKLAISFHTVKSHVHSICSKLQVAGRVEAAVMASQRGWLDEAKQTNV